MAAILTAVAELSAYLPIQEAAQEYQTSDDTLYRLLREGKLTRHRRPYDRRTWLIRSELDAIFGRPERVDD